MDSGADIDSEAEKAAPEGRSAKPWLALLKDAEKAEAVYHAKCDSIDKLYASLRDMAEGVKQDREFQIFWANVEVLKEIVYSRAPVPVVSSRFKDRKPLPRRAADILERALTSDVEADDLHDTLKLVRDDLVLSARGVPWVRLGKRDDVDVPIAEHVDRKDFRHEPARKWREVGWVARRAWLTRERMRERFGDAASQAGIEFERRDIGGGDDYKGEKKAEVWEIWHKGKGKVAFVTPGAEDVLEVRDPWLDLTGFFPCPKPVYATVQRSTLLPVPDFVYYKDQVEEINELTARISALAEALRLRGFYPAGQGEVSEAIESAIKTLDNRAILVPISSFAALGGGNFKDSIVWLPVREVAEVITQLVALRRQLIEDVYEVTGISDIMRGQTDAQETLGAQQLKSQYGSVRVSGRQAEMVRIARDIIRMKAEIMAEEIPLPSVLEMAQVDDLPPMADVQQQAQQIVAQARQQAAQMAQQGEEGLAQADQAYQAATAQAQKMMAETVTQEQVAELFQTQRVRPFVLDIETDSTIQPDENAEKQRRVEFVTSVGGFIQQAAPLIMQAPILGPFAAETIQFMANGFRVGRSMDAAIDELAEQLRNMAQQPQQPDPKAEAEAAAMQAETTRADALAEAEIGLKRAQTEKTQREAMGPPPEPVSVDPIDRAKLEIEAAKVAGADRDRALAAAGKMADIALKERDQDMAREAAKKEKADG